MNSDHFIAREIEADLAAGRFGGQVVTRFPPEPNGYLHIGHAKAICLDFGMARRFGGRCHLRMDDTNPTKESLEYVEAIRRDVRWLGLDWGEHFYFASDYFDRMYETAEDFIRRGKAYVCEVPAEEWKHYRGMPEKPGRESPYRNRPVEESLRRFREMREGRYPDGAMCLRAKIDMGSPNLHLRDPVLYRILRATHYRTGDRWCIYPTYDFAHPLEDAFEGITHSLCTLEFEVHRPLYDWVVAQLDLPVRPRQIEFARLNLSYTVMSKRFLQRLVQEGHVVGWDDPRLPTLAGMRRRGYPPAAIRAFAEEVGVTKYESLTDVALLEHEVREELNRIAPRALGVVRPLRLILTNYPEGRTEEVEAVNNPEDSAAGKRRVPFSRVLYIERDDFREVPPPKYYRLAPGAEVRLRYAYCVRCTQVVKDPATGEVQEVRAVYDPESRGGNPSNGRIVRGTLHWVSAAHAVPVEFRLYDRLFVCEDPLAASEGKDLVSLLNPMSLEVVQGWAEPSVRQAAAGSVFQLERVGYFCVDAVDSRPDRLVLNRVVPLKDTWAKIEARMESASRPTKSGS